MVRRALCLLLAAHALRGADAAGAADAGAADGLAEQVLRSTFSADDTDPPVPCEAGTALPEPPAELAGRRLFVLLSTQRSGSTWVCNRISGDAQCGVRRDGEHVEELVMSYTRRFRHGSEEVLPFQGDRLASSVSEEEYFLALDEAFVKVSRNRPDASAIGFKVMYNAVPSHLRGSFCAYLSARRVTVLHLVRETTALVANSRLGARQEAMAMHETNATTAQRKYVADVGPEALRALVGALERERTLWDVWLALQPEVRYVRFVYEQLKAAEGDLQWTLAAHALGVDALKDAAVELYQVHSSRCDTRFRDFADRSAALVGTRTHAACAMLDAQPAP